MNDDLISYRLSQIEEKLKELHIAVRSQEKQVADLTWKQRLAVLLVGLGSGGIGGAILSLFKQL